LSQSKRLTDGRTDRQLCRGQTALHSMQRSKNIMHMSSTYWSSSRRWSGVIRRNEWRYRWL